MLRGACYSHLSAAVRSRFFAARIEILRFSHMRLWFGVLPYLPRGLLLKSVTTDLILLVSGLWRLVIDIGSYM